MRSDLGFGFAGSIKGQGYERGHWNYVMLLRFPHYYGFAALAT